MASNSATVYQNATEDELRRQVRELQARLEFFEQNKHLTPKQIEQRYYESVNAKELAKDLIDTGTDIRTIQAGAPVQDPRISEVISCLPTNSNGVLLPRSSRGNRPIFRHGTDLCSYRGGPDPGWRRRSRLRNEPRLI